MHAHLFIYTFPFKPTWAQLACILTITYLHTHPYLHMHMEQKTKHGCRRKSHILDEKEKNALQSILHRERKSFYLFNAKLIKSMFVRKNLCFFQ